MFQALKRLLAGGPPAAAPAPAPAPAEPLLVNAYCTNTEVAAPPFAHQLVGRRDRTDPELAGHLDGFLGYVQSRGDGQMSATRYHVLRHIQRVQQQLSFSVPDGLTDALAAWAGDANALLFLPDGHVRDPRGRILVAAADGLPQEDAVVPFPAEAHARKARTDALLAARGQAVPAHLPPVPATTECRLRAPRDVAGRALALFVVALKAESIATGVPIPTAELEQRFPRAIPFVSPSERAFLDAGDPSPADTTQFAWRYECLFLLEWALGLAATLPWPDTICNVAFAARTVVESGDEALLDGAALRPAAEILDALDLHYRLHWRVRQAQVDARPVPDGLDGGVVLERHRALNWLVRFEDADWDDVDTPT